MEISTKPLFLWVDPSSRAVGLRHSGTDVEAGLLPPRLCGAAAGSCFWMGFMGGLK